MKATTCAATAIVSRLPPAKAVTDVGAIATIATFVLALTPTAQLELIGQAIEQLDYAEAQRLSRILLADPMASPDHLVVAHLHAGGCSVVLDDEVSARAHLNAALRVRPAELPKVWATTPKVVVVYDEVSAELSVSQARAIQAAQGTLLSAGALTLGGAAVWSGGSSFKASIVTSRDLCKSVSMGARLA